jgi:hypothetical protein
MNAKTAKRLRTEVEEAIRLDPRISYKKLWKVVLHDYLKTPAKERSKFTIFQYDSVLEGSVPGVSAKRRRVEAS